MIRVHQFNKKKLVLLSFWIFWCDYYVLHWIELDLCLNIHKLMFIRSFEPWVLFMVIEVHVPFCVYIWRLSEECCEHTSTWSKRALFLKKPMSVLSCCILSAWSWSFLIWILQMSCRSRLRWCKTNAWHST